MAMIIVIPHYEGTEELTALMKKVLSLELDRKQINISETIDK